jgi:hypothetical protein
MQAGRIILRPDLLQLNEPLFCPLHYRLALRLDLGMPQESDERSACGDSQSKSNGSTQADPDREKCHGADLPCLIR